MELSAKEKVLIEEALQKEITARLAAEEQALRAARRADAEAAAAAAAATKLAALALAKDSMIHTSVQQVIPSQDVQVRTLTPPARPFPYSLFSAKRARESI